LKTTFLERIALLRRQRIDAEKAACGIGEVKRLAGGMPPALDAIALLDRWPTGRRAIIAEVKRHSPSKGVLNADLDAADLAGAYERGGAFAVSCLIEPDFFGGGLTDLAAVRRSVSIPVLYKDFIVDPYQLWQARACGADLALLIVALLGPDLGDYLTEAAEAGMGTLVEVHDEEELKLALDAGAPFIGVNNRNLKTFETDLAVGERLMGLMPPGVKSVAESGMKSRSDMDRMAKAGANAFLIGESLVTSPDPEKALKALAEGGRS